MPAFPNVRVPAEQQLTDIQDGFSGGLNTVGDAFELQRNQVTRAENSRLTQFGSATKRLGTQRVHAASLGAAKSIQGGFCWRKQDGTVDHVVVCNGVFYSGGGTYAIPMTWTSMAVSGGGAAISTTAYISFAAFRDGSNEVLFLADGGLILKYTGTALTRVATTPAAILYLTVYNQRLFGISGVDQTINYSGLNDGTTLNISGSGGGSAVVRTFGNQQITNIRTLRDSLALFHVTGISRFVGLTQDDISIATGVQGFSSDVGSLFPRSVVVVDGLGYFLSERGAYVINDDGVVALDSPQKPDPTTPIISALASSHFNEVTGVHDRINREMRFSIPGTGTYVLNYRLGSWTGPWTGAYISTDATSQWEAIDANGNTFCLFGSRDGFVRQSDVPSIYLDDVLSNGTGGNAFSLVLACKRMFTRRAESEKSYRWAYVFADLKNSTTALLTWSTFYGSDNFTIANAASPSIWGVVTWDSFFWGSTGATRVRIPLGGRGPFVDFTISDDGPSASIYSRVELVAFDLGPRG